MQKMKTRDCSMDIFRIMYCIGVLIYHIMDDVLWCGQTAKAIYFGASFCVPGFFLLSGYLLGMKNDFSMEYAEKKVVGIMAKLFGWVIFWSLLHYIRTMEIYNLLDNFVLGISAGGILPVAWFLFTYCFLIIVGYPLWHIQRKSNGGGVLMAAWMAALALGVGKSIMWTRPQSLWLHLYIGYFGLGLVLVKYKREINKKIGRQKQIGILLFINVCSLLVYIYKVIHEEVEQLPSSYYGQWFYTFWLVSLLLLISMVEIKGDKLQNIIKKLSANTFVVYLGHLPILLYITQRHPIQSVGMAIIFIILMFFGCEVVAEIFRKLPMLRKLV